MKKFLLSLSVISGLWSGATNSASASWLSLMTNGHSRGYYYPPAQCQHHCAPQPRHCERPEYGYGGGYQGPYVPFNGYNGYSAPNGYPNPNLGYPQPQYDPDIYTPGRTPGAGVYFNTYR